MRLFKKRKKIVECEHLWKEDKPVVLKGKFYVVHGARARGEGTTLKLYHDKCLKCGRKKYIGYELLNKNNKAIENEKYFFDGHVVDAKTFERIV